MGSRRVGNEQLSGEQQLRRALGADLAISIAQGGEAPWERCESVGGFLVRGSDVDLKGDC